MAKYVDEEHTTIQHNGMFIPVDMGNRHYKMLLEDGVVIDDYVAPPEPPKVKSKAEKLVEKLVAKGVITQEEADEL